MPTEKIFNLTLEQIKKQSGTKRERCDYNTPIRANETWEPSLRGSEKILNDPELREMMRKIYRGVKINDNNGE